MISLQVVDLLPEDYGPHILAQELDHVQCI